VLGTGALLKRKSDRAWRSHFRQKSGAPKGGRKPLPLISMIDDLWYKNCIIYCLSVGTYMDANGDGVGDFKGLLRRHVGDFLGPLVDQ
jgi:hypothetical protein